MFNKLLIMFRRWKAWVCAGIDAAMTNYSPRRGTGFAGGSLLALGIIGGAAIGVANGQPSIGVLAGLGVGILLFLLVGLTTRR